LIYQTPAGNGGGSDLNTFADNLVAYSTLGLAFLTAVLVLATFVYAFIAWKQYVSSRDPRIVIYPEISGDMVTIVVDNRGHSNAYGVRIWPDDETFNFYNTKLVDPFGLKIPVLGPGQRSVHIWFFWTKMENVGEPTTLTCTYDKSADGGKPIKTRFYVDPHWFTHSSIGLSKPQTTQLNESLSKLTKAVTELNKGRD
tara:strand:- start:414 stop:1007 length:594 start_codon:yes stop_codon:yes gene_type:complete